MIRVLALHGFGQNAEIFQKRTKDRRFEAESAESTFETFLEHFQSSIPRTSNPEKIQKDDKRWEVSDLEADLALLLRKFRFPRFLRGVWWRLFTDVNSKRAWTANFMIFWYF